VPTASDAWVRVIQAGKGYSGAEAAQFRRLIERTESRYALFKVLTRHLPPRGNVLEAGCGWACSSFALATRGIAVTALDISEKLIGELRGVQQALGGPVQSHLRLVAGDIFKLADLNERFDVVFSDGTYEHFLDPAERREILRNVRSRLKPGGKCVIAVPNTGNLFFGWVVDARMPAMHRFRMETLADEIERGGFRVIERGYHFVNPGFEQWLKARWMARPIWAVDRAFDRFPSVAQRMLAAHLYCVAQTTSEGAA